MLCPSCGGKTHVPRSNISDNSHIIRQRVCKRCGHVELSVEVYLTNLEKGFELLAKDQG